MTFFENVPQNALDFVQGQALRCLTTPAPLSMLIFLASMSTALPEAHGSGPVYTVQAETVDLLRICVERAQQGDTQLVSRDTVVPVQAEDVSCGNELLEKVETRRWRVPAGCLLVCWNVRLRDAEETLASDGQSFRRGNFWALSEQSSLLRFADAEPERARLLIGSFGAQTVFPAPDVDGVITLPHLSEAPLVVLVNPTKIGRLRGDGVNLTYFIDDPAGAPQLPNMRAHMKAAKWLRQLFAPQQQVTFTIAWVGASREHMAITGVAMHHLLMANYPSDEGWPLGDAMLLYVALHEAMHQLVPASAAWLGESIASYYGVRATQVALPDDPRVATLIDKFRTSSATFPDGLLKINRRVDEGDRSQYGAFYAKGFVFWDEVDALLRLHGRTTLGSVLFGIRDSAEPDDCVDTLQERLGLPLDVWVSLRRRYLD